jgi:hypothetical protein
MDFETLEFPLEVVDRAGDALVGYMDAHEWFNAQEFSLLDVVSNWRGAHQYPLNTVQVTLRNRARTVDFMPIVVQRTKRVGSITSKLVRKPSLKLSEMQDIVGCRAILSDIEPLNALKGLYKAGYGKHELLDRANYIDNPKDDGYRSYHLIYGYDADDDRWGGRKVEIQLRTQLMHCWATAVETVDVFLKEGLKQHAGSPEWSRFFCLMSSMFALREGCRPVRHTPKTEDELVAELDQLDDALGGVATRLRAFNQTLSIAHAAPTKDLKLYYIVLSLNTSIPSEPVLNWYGFKKREVAEANALTLEEERLGNDAVMVSVSETSKLAQAYPNYFLDTNYFCEMLESFLQ